MIVSFLWDSVARYPYLRRNQCPEPSLWNATLKPRCATASSCAPTCPARNQALGCPCCCSASPTARPSRIPPWPLVAAERGYAVVIQDWRGRWGSDGDGNPFVHEIADGYDAVEWVAEPALGERQGRHVRGVLCRSHPDRLRPCAPVRAQAIAPAFTFSDPYEVCYQGGAFKGRGHAWTIGAHAFVGILRSTATVARGRHSWPNWLPRSTPWRWGD